MDSQDGTNVVLYMFQSSPGPAARCNEHVRLLVLYSCRCFNPHPALRPGATLQCPSTDWQTSTVSILTRPCGQVQRPRLSHITWCPEYVSILTRPCGQVQQRDAGICPALAETFQSSPGPAARCNTISLVTGFAIRLFQSSPGPAARCNQFPNCHWLR